MTNIKFDMEANDENVQKVLVAQQKEIAKLTAEVAKMNAASDESKRIAKDQAKAQADLNKQQAEANKIIEANKTETQKHADATEKLWKLKEQGLLTEEQYTQALANQTARLEDSAEAQQRKANAQAEANQMDAEAKRVIESLKGPEERRQERIKRLNDLRDKGLLSEQQHAAAIKKEGEALDSNAKSATSFTDALKQTAQGLGGMVAGFVSLTAVIGLLRAEWDAMMERQGRARDATINLASAQEQLIENLGGEDPEKMFARIRQLSKDTGIDEAQLTTAMNETLAARGDMSLEQVFNAVKTTSQVKRLNTGALPVMSGAVLDVQKQTGMDDKQALGFLMQLQSQSRVKSMGALAENVTPAIGSVMEFGADRNTAAAMVAALSHGMGDTTGAQSKTSAIQLAKQLEAFGGKGSDLGQLIKDIQADPQLQEIFLANSSFEAAALPAVRSLLGGGRQAEQFASARAAFGADPTGAVDQAVAARGASDAMQIADRNQSMKNVINQMQLGNVSGAESAVARDFISEFEKELGMGIVDQYTRSAIRELKNKGTMTFDEMANEVDQLATTTPLRRGPPQNREEFIERAREVQAMRDLAAEIRRQNDRFEAAQNAGAVAGKAQAQKE